MEKHNKSNLPRHFNEDCYNVLQTFQREKNINLSIHVRDLNAQGDEVYTIKQKTIRGKFLMQSFCYFMQELLGEDNVQVRIVKMFNM
jgi:hypothetical protein